MAVSWTKEQQQVISLRGRNILVSAAAGSGKTAVLVERIITRLTEKENPLDVDRLLVVTYTEAAAAEMKERIGDAIEKALEEYPKDEHLKRQSALIHTAKVTTIHSFCLSVIREYFHTIDLDPGFRIAEEGELKLVKQDVLKELLEEKYTEGSGQFIQFVETFATGREDTRLEEIILELYEYAGSYPDPEGWLRDCLAVYEGEMKEESPYMQAVMSYIRKCLTDISSDMKLARELCRDAEGPYMYEAALDADEEMLDALAAAPTYEEMYQRFGESGKLVWARLASNRDKSVSPDLTAQFKALREGWKKLVTEMKEAYFFQSPSEMEEDFKLCYPVMQMLVELVLAFTQAFAQKKTEKNIIDFRDMEQFALKILAREENGKFVPTEAAREYQQQFEEVMIDEYQDSNLIQEVILTSVSRESRGECNRFMVGDVKQSIYRFRLSRPELFMEKYDMYTQEDSECQRIDLHKNFRSRKEVLEGVNAICRQLMTKGLGGIEYDDNAALYVGAEYPDYPGNVPEVLVLDTEEQEGEEAYGESPREMEARAAAWRIKELLRAHQVWDQKTQSFRPARYSDIVILTRSLKGWTDVFSKILAEEGIPAFASSKEGYFGTMEIGWVLDYLKVLDNFRQDLPLAAVLKSPFGECTSEELAIVKSRFPEKSFYEAVAEFSGGGVDKLEERERHLWIKLQEILAIMESFRERVSYTAIHELLQNIIEETGYADYVAAMPGGEQRLANLEMLLAKAKAFESTSYKGLFHFVRYIGQLQKYAVDFGEAGIFDEKTNAVRLMSIHKSKGLEFPIVIVAGMGKAFNNQDVKKSVVIHPELGVGMDAVDMELRTKAPTILKKVIQKETELANLGEELRILYVALTRAKEKLILLGTTTNLEKKIADYETIEMEQSQAFPFTRLAKAHSYWDWVLPAVARLSKEQVQLIPTNIRKLAGEEVPKEKMEYFQKELFLQSIEAEDGALSVCDESFRERLLTQFEYRYPYAGEEQLKLKYTVSELKKRTSVAVEEEMGEILVEEEEVIPLIPKFLQEEKELKGASRGTAYHKVLELLDFTRVYDEESMEAELALFLQSGRISQEMRSCIRIRDLLDLLNSQSGMRMHQAACQGRLHKEQPFVFGIDAAEMYPEAQSEELVLIQGIIDVYFEEEDGLVVLDYKTDQVRTGQELADKYQEQLKLYGRALEQMTQKTVKEKVIYSFALKEEIELCRL